jgi:photosystem II stability/assembly factor-like uncharacterized protein
MPPFPGEQARELWTAPENEAARAANLQVNRNTPQKGYTTPLHLGQSTARPRKPRESTSARGRNGTRPIALVAIFGLWVSLVARPLWAIDSEAIVQDATLRAVTFINPDRGWVAGDFGTILSTSDSGTNWESQDSGTDAHLESIAMFNSQRGVVIGGRYEPHTQMGHGIARWTSDGGETWQPSESIGLPPLRCLLIGTHGRCIAAGDWSWTHMTSLFGSDDGGRTWDPILTPSPDPVIGLAGSAHDYLALTDRGELLRFVGDERGQSMLPPGIGRTTVAASGDLRLVGGGGNAWLSADGGATWRKLPAAESDITWSKSTLHGGQAWAIRPASSTLLRGDPTGIRTESQISEVPMRGLCRLDQDRGWAVGDWGAIAATRDGGATWQTLRGGAGRPAIMAVASSGSRLPWSLLGIESLQNRRRIALVTADDPTLIRQAARLLGATAEYRWKRPRQGDHDRLGPPPLPRQPWPTSETGDRGAELDEILRQCQPAVLVIDGELSVNEKAAWTQAAIQNGILRILETGRNNGQSVQNAAALTHAGLLAGDVWVDALNILAPGTLPPESLYIGARYDGFADQVSTDGLAGFVGSDRRYSLPEGGRNSRRHLQVLQARANESEWIASLVSSEDPPMETLRKLDNKLAGTDESQQQRLVFRMLAAAKSSGSPTLHRELLRLAAERWPDQPLGRLCWLWQQGVENSLEWQTMAANCLEVSKPAHLRSGTERELVQVSPFQPLPRIQALPIPETSTASSPPPTAQSAYAARPTARIDGDESAVAESGAIRLASGATDDRSQPDPTATTRVKAATAEDWDWQTHPAVLLTRRHQSPEAFRPGHPLLRVGPESASAATSWKGSWIGDWSDLARGSHADSALIASWASTRPLLDGRLVESIWRAGETIPNVPDTTERLCVAYDADFVYFGIIAPALPASVITEDQGRRRDRELDAHDRYSLRLDVDGDLLTAYELEFDAAGHTRDTCDGFPQWQPTWFIAVSPEPNRLTAEIAIRRSDLVGPLQTPDQHWHAAILRQKAGEGQPAIRWPEPAKWQVVRFN